MLALILSFIAVPLGIILGAFFSWHYWRFHRRLANIDEAFSRIQVVFDHSKRVEDDTRKNGRAITDLKTRVDKLEARPHGNPGGGPLQ